MLPVETFEAIYPSSEVVGRMVLRPMTLGHASLMEQSGIDLTAPVPTEKILVAAWILTMTGAEARESGTGLADRFRKWHERTSPDPYLLIDAVERQIDRAFSAFVPPDKDDGAEVVYAVRVGFGWTLELCEAMMSYYGMTFEQALDCPICRCYALLNCMRTRNGGKNGGPDYYERSRMAEASEKFRRNREAAKETEDENGE